MSAFFRRGPFPSDIDFEKQVQRFFRVRGAVSETAVLYAPSPSPRRWIQAAYRVYEARVQAWNRRRHLVKGWVRTPCQCGLYPGGTHCVWCQRRRFTVIKFHIDGWSSDDEE